MGQIREDYTKGIAHHFSAQEDDWGYPKFIVLEVSDRSIGQAGKYSMDIQNTIENGINCELIVIRFVKFINWLSQISIF